MRNLLSASVIAVVLLTIEVGTAEAGYCGAARYHSCRRSECRPTCCQCYTVMKTCKETIYEEYEVTQYKTVYEEVIDKTTVTAVKYVPQTAYRCVPCTIMQPQPCGSCDCCQPAQTCEPAACCKMVPVKCLRKVPYTTFNPVEYEKVIEKPRIVTKQVPYTVICCKPTVVCKQVPVKVCCPVPCCPAPCCEKPNCCTPSG